MNRFAQFAAAAAITLSAGIAAADYPIYASSFESPTYTAGQSVNNVDGWLVDSQTNDVTITAAGATPAAAHGKRNIRRCRAVWKTRRGTKSNR